ncbi:hypothetical protein, partial [Streptomyces sp. DSM 41634]|uniref:hypothetical protein n=1 Tax=Streptomyces sp. DSM 41634 TaxID=3448656 RepID=UPI00403FFE54
FIRTSRADRTLRHSQSRIGFADLLLQRGQHKAPPTTWVFREKGSSAGSGLNTANPDGFNTQHSARIDDIVRAQPGDLG